MWRFKKTFLCVALLPWLLAFGTAALGAADDWGELQSQASKAYPDRADAVKETFEKAQAARTPVDGLSMILDRSVELSVDADGFLGFVEKLSQASENGLPTEAFSDKIMEGLAKNVPPSTIGKVLDAKLNTYIAAKEITAPVEGGASGKTRALESVALAVERGVPLQTMRELYSGIKDPEVVYNSSYALADLMAMGFNEAQSKRIVSSGVAAGYLTDNHTTIPQIAAEARKFGRTPEDVAESMESDFNRGKPLSEIAVDLQGSKGGGPSGAGRGSRGGKGAGSSQGAGGGGRGSGRGGR